MPEQMTPRNPGTNTKEFISCQDQWRRLADFLHGRFGTWTLSRGVLHHLAESPLFSARRRREGGTTDSQTLWHRVTPTASSQGPGPGLVTIQPFSTVLAASAHGPSVSGHCFPSKPQRAWRSLGGPTICSLGSAGSKGLQARWCLEHS